MDQNSEDILYFEWLTKANAIGPNNRRTGIFLPVVATHMLNLTKEIIKKETNYHSNKILAEISHIPESRTGNILRRPVLRDFEIAYLSNSGVPAAYQIRL
jgi:hypothetical protein